MNNIYQIFANQLFMLLDGVNGHDPVIIKEMHNYLKIKTIDFLKKNNLEETYDVKVEHTNTLAYSNLNSDISVIEKKTGKSVLSIEYSSARTSFVKNKANNAANLISELYNYTKTGIPILWIFNAPTLSLEKLDAYKEYRDALKLFLDGSGQRPVLKNRVLTVDQLNSTHFSSLYKISKELSKNNSISEVLIVLIDFDYDKKMGTKSSFKNFKNDEVTRWLKDSTNNFDKKFENFLYKILIEKRKTSKDIISKIKKFLDNFKIIFFGK